MNCWYAVFCKPRQEEVAKDNLQRQGFNVYLPRTAAFHRRRGKWVNVIEPLFPRYLFIQVDPHKRSTAVVRSTRGAIDVVRFGDQPVSVSVSIIDAIKQQEIARSETSCDSKALFDIGETVKIVEGAFAGIDAIFNGKDGETRVNLLLELLGKTNRIKVNRDWVVQAT